MNYRPEIVDQVRATHAARLSLAAAQAQLATKRAEWEEANAELIAKVADHQQVVLDAEEALRALAQNHRPEISVLRDNPESRWLGPGVEVKISKEVFYDEPAAVRYAVDHKLFDTLAIKKREFDKIARAIGTEAGVQVKEIAKVFLATDLGKALDLAIPATFTGEAIPASPPAQLVGTGNADAAV